MKEIESMLADLRKNHTKLKKDYGDLLDARISKQIIDLIYYVAISLILFVIAVFTFFYIIS